MAMNKPQKTTFRLTPRQNKVLQALAEGQTGLDICTRMGVKPGNLNRWMNNKLFCNELARRIEASRQMGNILLIRCMPDAAENLASLMKAENAETARKACVDVLKLQNLLTPKKSSEPAPAPAEMDPKLAERLLKALAEDQ